MLLPSTKVAAKKLLILSKTKHDAKSAQEEGAKASKNGQSAKSTESDHCAHSLDQRRADNIDEISGTFPQ